MGDNGLGIKIRDVLISSFPLMDFPDPKPDPPSGFPTTADLLQNYKP